MEDVKIMENMKEVLKKTRKSKHKKSRALKKLQESDSNGDAISEILNKSWMFSSPPAPAKQPEEVSSVKFNAFERMMSKKQEPLAQISPEINGIKKKRKYTKKVKNNKVEGDNDNKSTESPHNENHEAVKTGKAKNVEPPPNGLLGFLNGAAPEPVIAEKTCEDEKVVEELHTRKRNRINDTTVVDSTSKKRKTKAEKMLLDSNENSLETPSKVIPEAEAADTPTYTSGRPRRSCAGKINYEIFVSPDKAKSPEGNETSTKRATRAKPAKKADESIELLVIDDESPVQSKKSSKLAPLFVKKVPKPSIDPAVKEARRNFLLLGLPEDLRSSIDKQKNFEDEILSNELIAFPSISHVTQLKSEEVNDVIPADMWQNSLVKFKANELECDDKNPRRLLRRGMLTTLDVNETLVERAEISFIERESIKNVKSLVKEMKEDFGQFPTNRCFKQLYWKHQKAKTEESDSDFLSENDFGVNEEISLFVDIFKPNQFDEFLINQKPVKELQKFLLTWNDKNKSSDYDSDDSSTIHSAKGLNNFVVLTGHNGSGKTSSIYALAHDLNYQVIEINAGSRRSGKKILQDLSEATQSHRVKNKSAKMLATSDEAFESSQESTCGASHAAKSIILIEDAELVFESDDGFVSSIQQLINISKRPVILTTNNRNCQHLLKFIQHNEIMYERPKSANLVGKYLSLLSLAADYQINAVATEHLFALNGHDLRKTINEIEFFIRSEGTRTDDGNLTKFYQRPRREWLNEGRLNYGNKCLSTIHFEASIVSSFAAAAVERANSDEFSYQQRHLIDDMAEYLAERCNVADIQSDLARGKQKIIER